ncbi:hypothetical protein ACWDZ8_43165 [Streptomyces sp. NPDC003233]
MQAEVAGSIVTVAVAAIMAVTVVLVVRFAVRGTQSQHRAMVLSAVAEIVRALRGRP